MRTTLALGALAAWTLACGSPPAEHGHSHGGHGHDHDEAGHPDGHDDAPSVAITRWSEAHELFVELDAPVAGTPFAYHAHVTHRRDHQPVSRGTLTLRLEQDGFVVESHTDPGVARPGIFSGSAPAPAQAGTYRLVLTYVDGETRDSWDAGEVQVGEGAPVARQGPEEGEITFLKEAQWQVPFRVAPAQRRALAPTVQAAGQVSPAPAGTTVVAAPVEGLVAWVGDLPVVGRTVTRGEPLAALIPAGAAEHWARLQATLATARIDRDLAEDDLARVQELAPGELIAERRIREARAALARAEARATAARQQIAALSSASAGAVAIRAPAAGTVVAVGARHGTSVDAGSPVVTVHTGRGVLVEGRVHTRTHTDLHPVAGLTVQRGDWEAPRDLLDAGATVLTERLIVDPRTLSAPVTVRVPDDVGLVPGDLVELSIGVGLAEPILAVPRSAIVEINGQDVVFVQRTGESFSRRRVDLGRRDATHVAVISGLSDGEQVVVVGGFDVHVASLSGALQSHRH